MRRTGRLIRLKRYEMKTQNELILEHLRKGNSITPLDALNRFGCFRLGARIWDLRKQGHNIIEKTVRNNGKHFSMYWLEPIQEKGQLLLWK
jgi:hypothetical protein